METSREGEFTNRPLLLKRHKCFYQKAKMRVFIVYIDMKAWLFVSNY